MDSVCCSPSPTPGAPSGRPARRERRPPSTVTARAAAAARAARSSGLSPPTVRSVRSPRSTWRSVCSRAPVVTVCSACSRAPFVTARSAVRTGGDACTRDSPSTRPPATARVAPERCSRIAVTRSPLRIAEFLGTPSSAARAWSSGSRSVDSAPLRAVLSEAPADAAGLPVAAWMVSDTKDPSPSSSARSPEVGPRGRRPGRARIVGQATVRSYAKGSTLRWLGPLRPSGIRATMTARFPLGEPGR